MGLLFYFICVCVLLHAGLYLQALLGMAVLAYALIFYKKYL